MEQGGQPQAQAGQNQLRSCINLYVSKGRCSCGFSRFWHMMARAVACGTGHNSKDCQFTSKPKTCDFLVTSSDIKVPQHRSFKIAAHAAQKEVEGEEGSELRCSFEWAGSSCKFSTN